MRSEEPCGNYQNHERPTCSYVCNLNSCAKIQAFFLQLFKLHTIVHNCNGLMFLNGYEPMTSAIPVQCPTN